MDRIAQRMSYHCVREIRILRETLAADTERPTHVVRLFLVNGDEELELDVFGDGMMPVVRDDYRLVASHEESGT